MEDVKLELMDWKQAEKSCEERIRELKLELILHELTRTEAKKQIKSFGGLASEEERKAEKKKFEEAKAHTI